MGTWPWYLARQPCLLQMPQVWLPHLAMPFGATLQGGEGVAEGWKGGVLASNSLQSQAS